MKHFFNYSKRVVCRYQQNNYGLNQGRRNRGGPRPPPNFSDDIKSALFPKAKCPHLFLEMFF